MEYALGDILLSMEKRLSAIEGNYIKQSELSQVLKVMAEMRKDIEALDIRITILENKNKDDDKKS